MFIGGHDHMPYFDVMPLLLKIYVTIYIIFFNKLGFGSFAIYRLFNNDKKILKILLKNL